MKVFERSMRAFLFCFCLSATSAQIRQLSTNDDGSQILFSTTYRLKASDEYINAKIFQFVGGAYNLWAQSAPGTSATDQNNLILPITNGDGSIVTWDQFDCVDPFCSSGIATRPQNGFVTGTQLPDQMTGGSLRVSHNGRYFVQFCCFYSTGSAGSTLFYDAANGALTTIPGYAPAGDGRQAIADDGTLLLTRRSVSQEPPAMFLWKDGTLSQISTGALEYDFPDSPRLSADGSTLVYRNVDRTGDVTLVARNLSTGEETVLVVGPPEVRVSGPGGLCSCPIFLDAYFRQSVSNDGQRVLFESYDSTGLLQLFTINSDGTGKRQLTSEPTGVSEGVLSGDGRLAYSIADVAGDLLAIDLASGNIQRLLPDLPTMAVNPIVPGSRAIVHGLHLAAADVGFAEFIAPLISSSANQVILQIPWELPIKQSVTLIASAAVSPFELAISYQSVVAGPAGFRVLHSDFSAVNATSPVSPGEIVVIQATGLGPVSPAIPTGHDAPDDPLSYVQLPISCTWQSPNLNAPVLFAGLAPEFVGLYQLNVQLPSDVPPGGGYLTCSIAGAFTGMSDWIDVGMSK